MQTRPATIDGMRWGAVIDQVLGVGYRHPGTVCEFPWLRSDTVYWHAHHMHVISSLRASPGAWDLVQHNIGLTLALLLLPILDSVRSFPG